MTGLSIKQFADYVKNHRPRAIIYDTESQIQGNNDSCFDMAVKFQQIIVSTELDSVYFYGEQERLVLRQVSTIKLDDVIGDYIQSCIFIVNPLYSNSDNEKYRVHLIF